MGCVFINFSYKWLFENAEHNKCNITITMKQPWIKLIKNSTKKTYFKRLSLWFFSSSSKVLGYSIKIKQCQQKARKSLMQSWTLDCLWATHATNLTLDNSKMLFLLYWRSILQEGSSINISWFKTSKGKKLSQAREKGMNRRKSNG